ncbi:TetR/AcrR family transcriptional regulator [Kordiimonas aestuarii]|uniref:TetR/AcrR family transcriptional regulator n=1 Tax=Kordiimonas aestuarii TaxID=1005925 RepID=UPI0021CEEB58|nr:TetR/AcrR family transcriptional regulator [Kordiimonas aestuarii]
MSQQKNGQSQKIIEVATRLYARYSYAKVTLEEIASELGSVPGAIYHYFEDKEDLIFHCYMNGLEIYDRELDDCSEAGLDALETVRRFVRQRFSPAKARMVLFTDIDALAPAKSEAVHLKRQENAEKLAGIIKRGVDEGSIRSDNPLLTAIAIFSVLDWAPFWMTAKGHYNYQDAVDALDDILAHGVYRRDIPPPDIPEIPDLNSILEKRSNMTKRLARVDHILKVAADNFNRKGALGVSINEIAADAGVTRAGIYYHFKDKESLLYHCLLRGMQMEIDVRQNISDDHMFEIQNTRSIFMLHATECGPCLTYHNVSFLSDEDRGKFLEKIDDDRKRLQERHQAYIDKGLYRNIDTYFAYRVTSGLHHWYSVWFRDQSTLSPVIVADHFTSLFLFGLKPNPLFKL